MTNKINGIDVSECNIRAKYFEKNICELGNRKLGELHYLCSENPDCYFKQLKRLQEENEKLKKRQITKNGFICDCEQNAKYRQALEEIKNFSENFCSNNCPYYTDKESNICNDGCLLDDIVNPIIKKIVEVLNDRD